MTNQIGSADPPNLVVVDWYSKLIARGWEWLTPPVEQTFGMDRTKVGALVRCHEGETEIVYLDKFTESIEVILYGRRKWFDFPEIDEMIRWIGANTSVY